MAVILSEYNKLVEEISTFSFRNEAHIRISKAKREIAYAQAIDIFVNTTDFNKYENGKSKPPIQFYGYIELVFQDALSLEIPIHFPRQRVYQVYQWEALKQWSDYLTFIAQSQYHNITNLEIQSIKAALEIPDVIEVEPDLWDTSFIELPLREIHCKMIENTQFQIEYLQVQPVPFTNPFDITQTVTGKSNQTDGEKDSGLPQDGIQPRQNPSSDPWLGNSPPSSASDIEMGGFSQLDPSNLENSSEPQITESTPVMWKITVSISPPNALDGCGVFRDATYTFTFLGVYGDAWTFPDCNPRTGLNGFCFYQNGIYKSEAYVCNPSVVVFDSLLPIFDF